MANGAPALPWHKLLINGVLWASGAAAVAGGVQIVRDWINFRRHLKEVEPLILAFHQIRLDTERRLTRLEDGQSHILKAVGDLTEQIKEERRERLAAK